MPETIPNHHWGQGLLYATAVTTAVLAALAIHDREFLRSVVCGGISQGLFTWADYRADCHQSGNHDV